MEIEAIYYYWDRVKGAVFTPNVGMRLTVSNRVIIEPRINVLLSVFSKESHSYYQERNTDQSGWATWESFYPDKRINDFEIQAGDSTITNDFDIFLPKLFYCLFYFNISKIKQSLQKLFYKLCSTYNFF